MALQLTRTVGTAVVFQIKDRTAELRFDRVQDDEVLFGLIINDRFKRARRSVDSTLNFQAGGELISVYVQELRDSRAVLRITASENVHILRRELAPQTE